MISLPLPIPPSMPRRKVINHQVHFAASILTFGLWLPCWAIATWFTNVSNDNNHAAYAQQLATFYDEKLKFEMYYENQKRIYSEIYGDKSK